MSDRHLSVQTISNMVQTFNFRGNYLPTRQATSVQHLQVQVSLIIVGLTDGSLFISLYVILETKPTIASVRDTAITSLKVDTNTL